MLKALRLWPLLITGMAFAMPKTVKDANLDLPSRLSKVLQWFNDNPSSASAVKGWTDFGDWKTNAGTWTLRKIAAGLKSIETNQAFKPDASTYPSAVETWVKANVYPYASMGTDPGNGDGDYDMVYTQIVALIYAFKDRPDLLTTNAIHSLIMKMDPNLVKGSRGSLIMQFSGQDVLPYLQKAIVNIPAVLQFLTGVNMSSVNAPETENHVLMILSSEYLLNQWVYRNYRNDPAIQAVFNSALHVNEGNPVEDMLLQCLGRIVKDGTFETNGRPYESYTLMAILNLYSYADPATPGGQKIKASAEAALDLLAVQFAMQSLEGKRFGPSRRNIDNRKYLGTYLNDYAPAVFGMLSGGYTSSDASNCTDDCIIGNKQSAGFGLLALLSQYRLPPAIHDFFLHKDNNHPGYGIWSRMESKFTDKHYLLNTNPVYLPGGQTPSPDLSNEPTIASPELYFLTESFANISGGDYDHYRSFDVGAYTSTVYDRFAKPTSLLISGDKAKTWSSSEGVSVDPVGTMGKDQMVMKGDAPVSSNSPSWWDHKDFYTSHNLGLYKNVAFGYSGTTVAANPAVDGYYGFWLQSTDVWPMTFPTGWTPEYDFVPTFNYRWHVRIFDLTANNAKGNPNKGIYVVAVSYRPRDDRDGYWGFWEAVPASMFQANGGVSAVYTKFSANGSNHYFNEYRTVVSDELLRFDYTYGIDQLGYSLYTSQPISSINGSAALAAQYTVSASMPLIESYQVDGNYNFTGVKYVEGNNGLITIRNPYLRTTLTLDVQDWKNPRITSDVKKLSLAPILSLLLN